MRLLLAAAVTLVAQRLLSIPELPGWLSGVMLPMVLVVAPRLQRPVAGLPWGAVALGLAWDALLEPVIGPGGVAWSAAALVVAVLARVIADRSPASWLVIGGVGAITVVLVRGLALLPLGLAPLPGAVAIARSALLTGAWCALVRAVAGLDLPARWLRWRTRRLR